MSARAQTLIRGVSSEVWREFRVPAACLGAGLLVFGLLFHSEVAAAIRTWDDSTAYNHCFLVVPIALWLIWDRRGDLRGMRAEPMPWVFLAGAPLAVGWLVAERLGIMEGRQLMALTFVELLIFALLGRRSWQRIAGPLLYLYFMVPFGEFLVPKLQDVTTVFVRHGLQLLNIPAFIDGYTIEIPEGTFYIAEACAGLRFLIASIAFGVLYALLMYRSPWRRVGFVVASIVVPVIANGFRALGIVALGHILGSAQAAATDHVLYGWIFFSLVILMLIALGLPFRQDGATAVAVPPRPLLLAGVRSRMAITAALAVVAMSAVSPAIAIGLNSAAVTFADAPRSLSLGSGCSSLPVPQRIAVGTPGRMTIQQVACGLSVFDLKIEVFSPRTTAGPVMAERRRQARTMEAEDTEESWLPDPAGAAPRVWRLISGLQPISVMAIGVWIDGEPARLGLPMRLRLAWTSLVGARYAPVLISVTPVADWNRLTPSAAQQAERNLKDLLLSHPDINEQVKAMADDRG